MKRKIELDDLDRKCLEEIPLLLEVLSTTSSKVEKYLSIYYKDMKEVINKTLPKNWKINEKSKHTYDVSISKIELDSNYYSICGIIHIEKEGNVNEAIYGEIGFYYSNGDDKFNCISFCVENGGPTKPLKYYKDIKDILKEFEVVIIHEDYDYDREYIEIRVNEFSNVKIEETYNVFKESILIPILNDLK